jgi:hypothetical protein
VLIVFVLCDTPFSAEGTTGVKVVKLNKTLFGAAFAW